jgi:hypothetical protein
MAAASVALAASGFVNAGAVAVATRGYPGVIAAFFFMLLSRTRVLKPTEVDLLGLWLWPAGGASICLGALIGVSTLFTNVANGAALPLAILGCPLVAIASLRMSTAVPRKAAFMTAAMAHLVIAAAAVAQLIKVWSALHFGS